MSREIAIKLSPEERELEKKRGELTALEAQLVQLELDLATLQAELRTFEGRYLRSVGRLYAELDEIEAQIAEALARFSPKDHAAQQHATHARRQSRESAQAVGHADTSDTSKTVFHPSDSLKRLYRTVARHVHPDLATNEQDRLRRHVVMAAVNRAYEAGDEDRLRQILEEWEHSPESVEGKGVEAELIRVIRKIAQVEERLQTIKSEMVQLLEAELYHLKQKVEAAEATGQDFLATLAKRVQEQIDQARARLKEVLS
jgi:DnaJ-domain-containing protein 1